MKKHIDRYVLFSIILSGLLNSCLLATIEPENWGGSFCNREGVQIWYRVEGNLNSENTPILLIHGGPGATAYPFEKTIGPLLARNRPVIYMDYRGSGRSDRPNSPDAYSFEILAADAEHIRQKLGIEKWAVFGHSNGGATALTYACNYPSPTVSLLLCDPLLSAEDLQINMINKVLMSPPDRYVAARETYQSDRSMEDKFSTLLELIDQETRYRFQYYRAESSDVLNQIQNELSERMQRGLMAPQLIQGLIQNGFFEFDAHALASDLNMPILLLLGRYDCEISLDNAKRFAMEIRNGYVEFFDKSGHHPYLEETEKCSKVIESFLQAEADDSHDGQ